MEFVYNGPADGPLFVFAHGAGAPLTSSFMEAVAQGLAAHGIRVARFNFPYMQQRVDTGSRRPPERSPKLIAQYEQLIAELNQPVFIGGKSMGGRMASLVAAQCASDESPIDSTLIQGVICLGYPFHPTGNPSSLRIAHLPRINKPLLIAQGERDKLGSRSEVKSYHLPTNINWLWLEDGDHDLKPRVKSGFTHDDHLAKTINTIAAFIQQHCD